MADTRILFVFCIICIAVAKPCSDAAVYKKEHCIPMTPQREVEIQEIIDKISDYVDELAMEHQYFDIRLMKFAIEGHRPDEVEDKDVQIQVTINDCTETFEANGGGSLNSDTQNASTENSDTNNGNNVSQKKSDTELVQPEVLRLDLDKNGQEVVELLQKKRGKKRPIVVYIQSGKEHYFLRR